MSEQRVTSETGAAKGDKLARFDLIPTYALTLLAETYGRGLAKYPTEPGQKDNWRRGYAWSLSYAALQRHLNAFWSGEDYDPETGNHHLISAVFHAFSLVEWGRHPELVELYDDRQDVPVEPPLRWVVGLDPINPFVGPVKLAAGVEEFYEKLEQADLQPFMDQINTAVKGLVDDAGSEEPYIDDSYAAYDPDNTACSPSTPCRWCLSNNYDKEVTE